MKRILQILTTLLLVGFLARCAEIQLGTIPPPTQSAKLRVFVYPTTGTEKPHGWSPYAGFRDRTYKAVQRFLARSDIYEVVPKEDVESVLGEREIRAWTIAKNDWKLAREAGRALYSEYEVVVERGGTPSTYVRIVFINVHSGKQFEVLSYVPGTGGGTGADFAQSWQASYRKIFRDAKKDLLATAIGKGRMISKLNSPVAPWGPEIPPPVVKASPSPMPPQEGLPLPSPDREVNVAKAPQDETILEDRVQVAVYDFDSPENMKVVALILSDALREELLHSGRFTLVSRENIRQVLEELKLRQIGLVDGKQTEEAARVLAADEIIVGRMSVIGNKYVLQLKRIHTETNRTLNLTSFKCGMGKEEELLDNMPMLARKLAEIH